MLSDPMSTSPLPAATTTTATAATVATSPVISSVTVLPFNTPDVVFSMPLLTDCYLCSATQYVEKTFFLKSRYIETDFNRKVQELSFNMVFL